MENNLTIVLSSRFKEILIRISQTSDNISKFILGLQDNLDYIYPFSFLDITDTEDQISFIQSNKYHHLSNDDSIRREGWMWSNPSRNEIKIGRLIMKLAPIFKPQEIEKFVNMYKAEYKNTLKNIKFLVVEGDEMVKYYNGRKYAKGAGSLNKSCMRHDQCSKFMDLYRMNPDKIKLLVLLDSRNDLLKGRAILWKLDVPENSWLLDRIYTTEESDVFLFKKHAEKNGWFYKGLQTFDAVNIIKDGEESFVEMRVNDINGDFPYFPYIDTLLYYNTREKYLTNVDRDYDEIPDVIKLREINGNDSGNENFVYDSVNKRFINIMDSTYCYYGDVYTHTNNAFFIKKLDEFCLPELLRYSDYHNEFLTSLNTVYSFKLKSFVKKDKVAKVYLDKERSKYDYYDLRSEEYAMRFGDGKFYKKEFLIKGIDDKYYFIEEYNEELIKNLQNKDRNDLNEALKDSKLLKAIFQKKKKLSTGPYISSIDSDNRWWTTTTIRSSSDTSS